MKYLISTDNPSGDNLKKLIIAVIALIVMLGAIGLLWSILRTFDRPSLNVLQILATLVSVPILLLGFHYRHKLPRRWQILWGILVLAIIVVFGFANASVMYGNIVDPQQWDFLCFWLDGHVAIRGLNFYKPESYQGIPLPIVPDQGFTKVVLEVGFWYPPPTMFLFLPLGLFGLQTAMILWYIVHCVVLVLDIVLLWKIFLSRAGLMGLVLTIALTIVLAGTLSTLRLGQINFLVLLMLLLYWWNRDRPHSGIWLILGTFVKPYLAIMLLYPLLRRQWRVLLTASVTLVAITLLTLSFFGSEIFFSYFTDNPVSRLPDGFYTDAVTQSLLSTILRITEYDFSDQSPLYYPPFLVLALILTGITCWITFTLEAERANLNLALILLLSLIVYPGTLNSYSFVLIVPILVIWVNREEIPIVNWGIVGFLTVVSGLNSHSNYVFVANALLWLALALFSTWTIYQRRYHAERLHLNA
jgi:hypothetical protein